MPDSRYIPIKMHYSICALPEVPMTPRMADNRVGNFMTVMKDFSRDNEEDFFVRYVNRWRLEKKDPNAEMSEPVKPIVFYLDRTMPDEYKPWVRKGIENWQEAFEAAGFKNAILAKDAPTEEEDPDWDAEDVRYSTIRWIMNRNSQSPAAKSAPAVVRASLKSRRRGLALPRAALASPRAQRPPRRKPRRTSLHRTIRHTRPLACRSGCQRASKPPLVAGPGRDCPPTGHLMSTIIGPFDGRHGVRGEVATSCQ